MACLLEYAEARVTVTDIIHVREGHGWRMEASSYAKLRLSASWVTAQLADCGRKMSRIVVRNGLVAMLARK